MVALSDIAVTGLLTDVVGGVFGATAAVGVAVVGLPSW